MDFEPFVAATGLPIERLAAPLPRGGVVLVCEVAGIDAALRDYARRLATEGWSVAMPDLWWRRGRPPVDTSEAIHAAVAALPDHEALADIQAARAALPAGLPQFVVGFCVGGLYARMAGCTQLGLAGVVEFYGRIVYPSISAAKPVQPLDLLPGLSCPIQSHFGTHDAVAPEAHIDELERRLRARTTPSQVFRYEGCRHAFMNPDRPAWAPDEACTAWGRALTFLEQVGARG